MWETNNFVLQKSEHLEISITAILHWKRIYFVVWAIWISKPNLHLCPFCTKPYIMCTSKTKIVLNWLKLDFHLSLWEKKHKKKRQRRGREWRRQRAQSLYLSYTFLLFNFNIYFNINFIPLPHLPNTQVQVYFITVTCQGGLVKLMVKSDVLSGLNFAFWWRANSLVQSGS